MLKKRPASADAAKDSGQGSMKVVSSMKTVSRVLLGTASGFAMAAGAHAAELGDKAEPVQFVKICSLDGHSYYYIPGNDVCTKSGLSLTIGTDDRRGKSLMNLSAGAARIAGQSNDPIVSLRADQAWGFGALVGGAHNASATYTGENSAFGGLTGCLQTGATDCGRPRDKAGFFIGLGGELKLPMLGAGDRIGAGVRYSQGAPSGFGGALNLPGPDLFGAGNNAAVGWMPEGGSGIELTTAWSVQAGYDHQWSPSLNTSLFAGYSNITYDAPPASAFVAAACAGNGATAQPSIAFATGASNCKSGNVGAGLRTSWAPASGLTLSVQTMYNYAWSGFTGTGNVFGAAAGARPAEPYNFANQGVWSSYLSINRTFNTGE
jgi:hypothetical protein